MTKSGRKRPTTLPGTTVIAVLKKMGADPKGQKGSHLKLEMVIVPATARQAAMKVPLVVPNDSSDLTIGTFRSILRSMGPRRAEFWDIVQGANTHASIQTVEETE